MANPNLYNVQPSKLAAWLMKISGGAIKNEKQANMVMIIISIIVIAISLVYIFNIQVIPRPEQPEIIDDTLFVE